MTYWTTQTLPDGYRSPSRTWQDVAGLIEAQMTLFLPFTSLGCTFEAWRPLHIHAGSTHIMVRMLCDPAPAAYDAGHGPCALCCRYLPEIAPCPCGCYEHDHAFSFCVTRTSSSPDLLRICAACYRDTKGPIVLSLVVTTGGDFTWVTMGGTTILTHEGGLLPLTHLGLTSHLMKALSTHLQGPRFATDGYMYGKDSFMDYYGPHGIAMWTMAAFRTYQLQAVHGCTILERGNYDAWRVTWDKEESRPTNDAVYLYLKCLLGSEDYIPAKHWPHEPLQTLSDRIDGWIQCLSEASTLQEFLSGRVNGEALMEMFTQKLDHMAQGVLSAHPTIAVAYSMLPGDYHAPQVMVLWPHCCLQAIAPEAHALHTLIKYRSRIIQGEEEDDAFRGAPPPSKGLELWGRFPPHYLLAHSLVQYKTAAEACPIHYARLADQWAGGRRGLMRYRQCLIDMLGPSDFLLRHGAPQDLLVDLEVLRGYGDIA